MRGITHSPQIKFLELSTFTLRLRLGGEITVIDGRPPSPPFPENNAKRQDDDAPSSELSPARAPLLLLFHDGGLVTQSGNWCKCSLSEPATLP